MSKPSKDEAYEVSDSTDWLETPLPSLAPVDSALRCQVCRDFYNTPMIMSCSHTFCSLCVRHCLTNDGKCPTCRNIDDASKLRNNYALEELVEAFKNARPEIMEYVKRKEEAVLSASAKRKRVEAENEEPNSSPVQKRTRSGRRAEQSSQRVVVIDSEADDDDYVPEQFQKAGQIQCPICQDSFPTVQAVEAHVDHCNGEPLSRKQKPKSTQTSLPPQPISKPTKRPDRLPQLHYGTVKDNALRKKLQDLGILATGSRQLMERRYTEWVTLWNANCDSKNPKLKGELKKELDVWERTQGGGAPMASRANLGGNIRDKNFDGSAWLEKHDDSFRQLIAEARRRRAVTAETGEASGSAVSTDALPLHVPYNSSDAATPASTGPRSTEHQSSVGVDMIVNKVPLNTRQLREGQKNEIIPPLPPGTSSQRRFFEENTVPLPSNPPSSQTQTTQMMEKDIDMNSDMATLRPLQP